MSTNAIEVFDPWRIVEVALISLVHATTIFHKSLKAVCQIVIIAVVELFLLKQSHQSINVRFIRLVSVNC